MTSDHPSAVQWVVILVFVCVPLAFGAAIVRLQAWRERRGGLTRSASRIDLRRARS